MITCLVLAACAGSPSALAKKPPSSRKPATTLPAEARIVRHLDVTLPAVSPAPSALPGANQRDVVFIDARTGFLATGGEEIATDQGGTYSPISGGIQRTIDGGKTWQTVWSEPGADISTVLFVPGGIGFAAGRLSSSAGDTSAQGQSLWLRTTNGGATWTAQNPQLPEGAANAWPFLRFAAAMPDVILGTPNPNDLAIDDLSIMLRSADGGMHWSRVGPQKWVPSGGIAFATPSLAFAGGYLSGPAASPRLWASRNAGANWSPVSGTSLPFNVLAVDFVDPIHGFAAGGNLAKYELHPSRALLATNDGGRSWALRYESSDSDVSNPISRLHFVDANHGWASIGSCSEGQNGPCGGPIVVTADGGRGWRMTGHDAVALSPVSPTEGWAVDAHLELGAFLSHSNDSGASWVPVVRPGALPITSLAGARGWLVATTSAGSWQSTDDDATWSAFEPPILTPLRQLGAPTLAAQPPGLLVVDDEPALHVSNDAGAHEFDVILPGQDVTMPSPVAVAFSDASNGVAIVGGQACHKAAGAGFGAGPPVSGIPGGSATVAVTSDGGTTWSAQGTLDIQPWGVGATHGFWAIAGSAGCATPLPVLMISQDEGRHWMTQNLPERCLSIGVATPGAIWLSCLDSSNHGDLLVTRDGAITWTKYHFPQGLPNILVTGASEAWAYGPAGALWHTTTGGGSWTSVALAF